MWSSDSTSISSHPRPASHFVAGTNASDSSSTSCPVGGSHPRAAWRPSAPLRQPLHYEAAGSQPRPIEASRRLSIHPHECSLVELVRRQTQAPPVTSHGHAILVVPHSSMFDAEPDNRQPNIRGPLDSRMRQLNTCPFEPQTPICQILKLPGLPI
jgi:hypothetical protein